MSKLYRTSHNIHIKIKPKTSLINRFLAVVVALLTIPTSLTGCGFELRGYSSNTSALSLSEETRITTLYVECAKSDSWHLCQHLRQQLKLNHIALDDEAELALIVEPIKQSSRVLSLQSNASAAEYGLNSSVNYRLIHRASDTTLNKQSIQMDHSYRHESSALLAKERERAELQKTLSQQLALEIYRQVSLFDQTTINSIVLSKNDQPE